MGVIGSYQIAKKCLQKPKSSSYVASFSSAHSIYHRIAPGAKTQTFIKPSSPPFFDCVSIILVLPFHLTFFSIRLSFHCPLQSDPQSIFDTNHILLKCPSLSSEISTLYNSFLQSCISTPLSACSIFSSNSSSLCPL